MCEDIIVDNKSKEHISMFNYMYLFDLKMGCHTKSRTLLLNYSDMYMNIDTIRIPERSKSEFFPEKIMIWNLCMSHRMTVMDYIIEFGFLHEDLHIVVRHLLEDEEYPEKMDREKMEHIQKKIVDSVECYSMLFSLIGHIDSNEEMWERISEVYEALHNIEETGNSWVPPDMRGRVIPKTPRREMDRIMKNFKSEVLNQKF